MHVFGNLPRLLSVETAYDILSVGLITRQWKNKYMWNRFSLAHEKKVRPVGVH